MQNCGRIYAGQKSVLWWTYKQDTIVCSVLSIATSLLKKAFEVKCHIDQRTALPFPPAPSLDVTPACATRLMFVRHDGRHEYPQAVIWNGLI